MGLGVGLGIVLGLCGGVGGWVVGWGVWRGRLEGLLGVFGWGGGRVVGRGCPRVVDDDHLYPAPVVVLRKGSGKAGGKPSRIRGLHRNDDRDVHSLRILHAMKMEQIFEIGVLSALALPALRAATSSAYRRVFPFDSMRIGVAAAAYVTAVAAVAIFEPRWLRPLCIPAAAVLGYLLWRARPSHGTGSALPPGSLQLLPVRPWSDPEFYAKQARRHGEIFKMSQFGQPMVCVLGLERANRLLLEHDAQLVAPPLPFSRFIEGGYLRYLPEETHARYRRIFRAVFHSEVLASAEPRIASVFRDALNAMADESVRSGQATVILVST